MREKIILKELRTLCWTMFRTTTTKVRMSNNITDTLASLRENRFNKSWTFALQDTKQCLDHLGVGGGKDLLSQIKQVPKGNFAWGRELKICNIIPGTILLSHCFLRILLLNKTTSPPTTAQTAAATRISWRFGAPNSPRTRSPLGSLCSQIFYIYIYIYNCNVFAFPFEPNTGSKESLEVFSCGL